jgi:HlyD family secretion protein
MKLGGQVTAVESAIVIKGSIEEYVEEKGTVILEEETEVFSTSAGKVVEVTKKAGDRVKAGDVLVRFDNKDLLLQIKALESQRLIISAKYAEVKSSSTEEEVRKLSALVRSAEASYDEAKRLMDNNRSLYEIGAISLDTYKSSITKLASAEANLETAKSDLALAEKGLSVNIRKQYEAQLSEAQARITQLKVKNEEMVVKAPIDGLIMAVEISEGNIVQSGEKLYEIGGSKGLYIESDILIEDIKEVKEGSTVRIEDEDLGIRNLTGSVRKIYPKAESIISDLGIEQKRVKIDIDMNNSVESLKPGYDMTVKVVTRRKEDTLLIPDKAVFEYQGKDHVFVNEEGIAKLRAIETGLESNEQVEVVTGLTEGEIIILTPADTLNEGTKVSNKEV